MRCDTCIMQSDTDVTEYFSMHFCLLISAVMQFGEDFLHATRMRVILWFMYVRVIITIKR
jgi:hypothetical protein